MVALYKSIARHVLTLIAVLSFSASLVLNHYSAPLKPEVNRQIHTLSPRAQITRFVNLGMNRAFSDLLWIHTLMESDVTHYTKGDLGSWIYLRLREIVTFDPRFWEAYYYGAEYLMIVKNDLKGAEDLLRKGLDQFPNDFGMNFKMGYLQAIELQRPEIGYFYFNKVRHDPRRPFYFDSMLAKMAYSKLEAKDAIELIRELMKGHSIDSAVYQRLYDELYSIKAHQDLECLNANRKQCEVKDLNGVPYKKNRSVWSAEKKLVPLRLKFNSSK